MDIHNIENIKERLFNFIDNGLPEYECWEFQGALSSGYGRIKINGSAMLAHRVSYWVFVSPFDTDLYVCHKCDNPCCINPNHLFLGTQSDNMKDSYRKGRTVMPDNPVYFEKGHIPDNSQLSMDQARRVKSDINDPDRDITLKELANKHGIKYQTVRDISAGRSYINA